MSGENRGLRTLLDGGVILSMIAGWNPGQTYWLHDIRSYPDTSTNWVRDDDTEMWRLADGQ